MFFALPFIPQPLRVSFAHRRIDLFRGNRQIFYSYANGVFDRIGDRRRHRRDWILADAFDVVRANAVIARNDNRLERWNILDRGNFVLPEVRYFDMSVSNRKMLDQTVADSLNNAAIDLALMSGWIHDRAGVVRRSQFAQCHFAGLRIHRDLGDMRGKGSHRRMLVIAIHRHRKSVRLQEASALKG